MGEYAEYQLAHDYRRGTKRLDFDPVPSHQKVACPLCGKLCGGRGLTKHEGAHAHMKFKHGIRQKWKRVALLEDHTND